MLKRWLPTTVMSATLAALVMACQPAWAEKKAGCDCGCDTGCDAGCDTGCDAGCDGGCDGCGLGCGRGHGLLGRCGLGGKCKNGCKNGLFGRNIAGWDAAYNCGCNGSYNYPVPPLYTYHWPGLYKQQLMTDYHSPWRFPAIKPYSDEDVVPDNGSATSSPGLLPISYETTRISTGERSMADRVRELYR